MKKVMVFGVFDGVHEGHRYFLREAKKLGDKLIVVVAKDKIAKNLKGKMPRLNLDTRIRLLRNENIADEIVVGDEKAEEWSVIKKYQPDLIAVGYDQQSLRESLKNFNSGLQVIEIGSYEPEKYHTSLLKR